MEDEHAKTLSALRFAIQMEIDGKQYYRKASQKSSSRAGRELFEWLAAEEDKHRQKFEAIYNAVKSKKGWPDVDVQPLCAEGLGTLFSRAVKEAELNVRTSSSELDAISRAMDMENKTLEFYQSQTMKTDYEAAKKFFATLAAEEKGHYLALVDYREYLVDPAGWFRKAEHHTLDGA